MKKTARVIRSSSSVLCALLLGLALAGASPTSAAAQAQNERPPATAGPHEWHPEALKAIDRLKSPH